MEEALLSHEPAVRLGAFAAVLVALLAFEALAPRRRRERPRAGRWAANLGMTALSAFLARAVGALGPPFAAVGMAALARERGFGLLGAVALPRGLEVALTVVALDLAIYLQHVLFHAVPAFWRIHRVHHADLDVDATTGIRFHPVEILLSLGVKLAAVAVIGAPVAAVVVFEVLLNATSMFNHANLRLGARADRALRWLLVTPDMHRVHHSVVPAETNANFGFNLPWWDRLFGTYRPEPAAGHDGMTLGLADLRDPRRLTLRWLLALPFLDDPSRDPRGQGARAARAALLVVLAAGIAWALVRRDDLDAVALGARLSGLGPWAPVAFVGLYAVGTVLFVPGSLLTTAGGALFGPFLGAALSLAGATLGASAAFLIARFLAADFVARRTGGRLRELLDCAGRAGFRFVAFVRLVPVLPFNALNYALGVTPVRFAPFFVASLVCMAPGALAYASLGWAGREAAAGRQGALGLALVALGTIAGLALVPPLLRHRAGAAPGRA